MSNDDDVAGMLYAQLWLSELGRVVPDDPSGHPRWADDVRPEHLDPAGARARSDPPRAPRVASTHPAP